MKFVSYIIRKISFFPEDCLTRANRTLDIVHTDDLGKFLLKLLTAIVMPLDLQIFVSVVSQKFT